MRGAIVKKIALISLAISMVMPGSASPQDSLRQDILRAIDLPRAAAELREAGLPVDEVRAAIETARRRQVPAAETDVILEEANQAVEEHGPIDNFGAFVQAQLETGLRGRELAAAIRAEHESRGIGRGRRLERSGEAGRGQGRPEAGGRRGEGRPTADDDTTARRDSAARGRRGRARRDTIPQEVLP